MNISRRLRNADIAGLMVQEHSVETPSGQALGYKHVPHRLVARNSKGETLALTALIKTQGSDTKLVAQMQPYLRGEDPVAPKSGWNLRFRLW